MWKKLLVSFIVLAGAVTAGYAYFNYEISAAGTAYMAGGNVSGRINISPSNLTVTNARMQLGDKFYLETKNPMNGNDLGWIIVGEETGDRVSVTMTTEAIAYSAVTSSSPSGSVTSWLYKYSLLKSIVANLNNDMSTHSIDVSLIAPRSEKGILWARSKFFNDASFYNNALVLDGSNYETGKSPYTLLYQLDDSWISSSQGSLVSYGDVQNKAITFSEDYWDGNWRNTSGPTPGKWQRISSSGSIIPTAYNTSSAVRPALNVFLLDNVVFAVSAGSTNGMGMIDDNTIPGSYSNLWTSASSHKIMKLRIKNPTNPLLISFNDIQNGFNDSISKVVKNEKVYLDADAPNRSSTVSVLIFKEGKFYGYKPLEQAAGAKKYEFDTTGLPVGSYQIGLVNEIYSSVDTAPAYSSEISDVLQLDIVEPHKLTYTKTPQSGATLGDYEFSKNVNAGQTVGKMTVNPQGVMPLTYSVDSNGDNTYQNFEIDGLSGGISSSTSLNIKIKGSAPDLVNGGLKAGTYKFCVSAVDANGNPTTATADSKVCTSFNVEKTNLSVSFNAPAQTKKSITDAATSWNETATATPNSGTKITYSVSGGDVSLITIDPNTAAVTYRGTNAFGKVKIRAAVDDDPSTGYDNYNAAFVEKEIVIYREVDGIVTPHSNSSNTTIPTFTASDSNVREHGIIGTIHGTLGTPDTISGSTTTYRYGIKPTVGDASFFSVDPSSGVIKTTATSLGVQSYHIIVTVSDNWSTKEIPLTINVGVAAAENLKFYENSSSSTVITTKSARATDTGVSVFATVRGSSNTNPVKYRIRDGSTNVIEVNENSGAVTIHRVGTVVVVAEKLGASGQANAYAELTFTVTAGAQNFIYTDASGNELPKTGGNYDAKEEDYLRNGTFQLYTDGNPPGSTVTYQLKTGSPTDVISVDSNTGLVSILNASLSSQLGKVIVEATSHDPLGNYSDSTIEIPINIKKANQTVSFAGVTYAASGSGQVTPVIIEQDISSNEGGVTVNDTAYYITIDSSISTAIAWTNNGIDIDYNYNGATGLTIPLEVVKQGNRNYNQAQASGSMKIMGPNENTLAINRPGRIIYGDHFTIRSLQDDSSSVNVNYTFTVDNTTYISNPTVSGNMAEFDALKYSGSTNINISVTRTADGELPLSKTITVQVLPKPIEIIIDDKEKYKGEQNPVLTYQDFRNQLVSWNGVRDEIQEHDIQLSTTANTSSNAGNYPIKGDSNLLNNAYPNYSFTFKEGTLKVKEEVVRDDWYHLEEDDGNNTPYTGNWTNQNVNIISNHSEYKNLSLDQSTWRPNQVTVTKEGESNQSFWMKKDSGAITKEKKETIKIDKTAPKVKGIKAKDTNNKLQDIINKLSGGIFFKPGTAFEITTDDSKDNLKVSGTKAIAYKVYQISDGTETEIKNGTLTVTNEKASITISETVGKYKVCVIPTDNAGNTNKESCHEVELKKIDVDVDKDGKPDFNDPDEDGCPDLNIKWKDPNDNNKWIIINGDRDYDGIPDLNIDSDGDGKADLNIDTDNDGKPDLNLVILKKNDWKPTKCVKVDIDNGILEEYCTGTSVKAVTNVDTDDDGIPNINIDTNGDMKADINISKDGVQPIINIVEITNWIPDKDYKYQKFSYDTMKNIIPLINVDTDGDGRPDANIDLDGDGSPDINIDVDHDGIPDIDIDSDGDGKPNVNVDTDGDGKADENIIEIKEWKPEKNIDGDLPYDTMDFSNSNEPDNQDKTDDDKPKTSVKGQYNPVSSMGGANTGDETNLMLYICMTLSGLGTISYLLYRYQKDTF